MLDPVLFTRRQRIFGLSVWDAVVASGPPVEFLAAVPAQAAREALSASIMNKIIFGTFVIPFVIFQ